MNLDEFSRWAHANAKRDYFAAIRENVQSGTDFRFPSLVQRFKQRGGSR